MRSQIRRAGGTGLALVLLAGCSEAAPVMEEVGPQRPSAVGEPLVVEYGAIGSPVVLDPLPEGFEVDVLSLDEVYSDGFVPEATLYGDPTFDDTLDGRVLLVGDSSGSAYLGGAPRGMPDERQLDIGRLGGWLTHDGARTYVGLEVDEPDYAQFLIGRGLTDEEMIAVAETATFEGVARVDPGSLPDGMQPLIESGPGDGPFSYGTRGLFMELSGPDARMLVDVVRADPRLAALWGFWTGDPEGTEIGGMPGSDGTLGGTLMYAGERGVVWAEDGLVYAVAGTAGAPVDAVAAGLRPGTDAEFAATLQTQQDRVVTAEDLGCPPGSGVVSAVAGDMRWAFALGDGSGRNRNICWNALPLGQFPTGANGGDGFELAALGQISSYETGGNVEAGSPISALIAGVAPPGTTRLVLAPPGRPPVDAVLADGGPRPGEIMWGQWLHGYDNIIDPVLLTAYDEDGNVLDTRPTR